MSEALDPDGWIKRETEAELDARADEKVRLKRERSELSRLRKFMKLGAKLIGERVEGVGVIYRTMARTASPFSAETVATWCAKSGHHLPDIIDA